MTDSTVTDTRRFEHIIGIPYDRLTVLSFHSVIISARKQRREMYSCKCSCGSGTIVVADAYNLLSGNTRSCGCLQREEASRIGTATRTHGQSDCVEYKAWVNMRERCYSENNISKKNYLDRGIVVCQRWLDSFENFFADMGPRPSPKHSLDRFPDKDGNYEPGNCRWATAKQQQRNTRYNRVLTHNGISLCIAELAEITGISSVTIIGRLNRGWSVEKTIGTPVRAWHRHTKCEPHH